MLLSLFFAGASRQERAPAGLGGSKSLLVVSGNDLGFIRPCGCSRPALGGIGRRAQSLKDLRRSAGALTAVSLGNLVDSGGRQQRIKFETFLAALEEMHYQALVPGPGELLLGLDYLREEAPGMTSVPFVCLNLYRAGQPVFQRSLRIKGTPYVLSGLIPAGTRVPGAELRKPEVVLPALLKSLGEHDRLVLLYSGAESGARGLARTLPAAFRPRTRIFFGGGFDVPALVKPEAGVFLASVGSKGRHLSLFQLDPSSLVQTVTLTQDLAADKDVGEMLASYRDQVREEKLVEKWPRKKPVASYVDPDSCTMCHQATCETLARSKHAQAFKALVKTNDQFDPECVRCHVTGWGDLGGYVSPTSTPALRNVSCQACHGPGGDHLETQDPTPNGQLGKTYCLRCHDPSNSPQFQFKKYWPKIKHPR